MTQKHRNGWVTFKQGSTNLIFARTDFRARKMVLRERLGT